MGNLVYPLPEVIARGPWDIRHLERGGHTGRGSRVFAAPLGVSPYARAVRAHELAHVRFSPSKPRPERYGVLADTLLAVEDGRVNELAGRAGLGAVLADLDDPVVEVPDPDLDLRSATLLLVATHGTRAFARVEAVLAAGGDSGTLAVNLARRALEAFTAPARRPSFRATVEVARRLDRLLGPPTSASRPAVPTEVGDAAGGRRGLAEVPARHGRWGELRPVEEPPCTIPCRRGGFLGRVRLTDEGILLRAPHRLLLDRRIFAHRTRARGGTVLVDTSSSMRLTARDIVTIVDAAAGAAVACYSGHADGWGIVRIIARRGRRVPDRLLGPPTGNGANVIDGPALGWLAEQPAPRIWVSDGMVTGVGDRPAKSLTADAKRRCRGGGIVRVPDAAAAQAVLRTSRARAL